MLLLRWGVRSSEAEVPLDPFLVADQRRPVNPFVFSAAELVVFPEGFKVAVELETGQHQHQIQFAGLLQASFEFIQEFLIFLARGLPAEMNDETVFSGLIENLEHVVSSFMRVGS